MEKKIEIKDIFGKVLFAYECEYNSMKKTVEEAVKQKISLYCADLNGAKLVFADLSDADFRDADLRNADLYGANLCGADLSEADLSGADLCGAYLSGADLSNSNLNGVKLCDTYLCEANLNGANLYGATLNGSTLNGAKNVPFIPLACPSEGSFVGWKKVDNYLIKLFIPEDAKRTSATTNKCRCDKAKVLEITNLETNEHIDKVINYNYARCVYKVGEIVYPDKFDDNRWDECSNGIHFFINKQEAICYH